MPSSFSRNPFPAPPNPNPDGIKVQGYVITQLQPIPPEQCNTEPQPWQHHAAKLAKRPKLFPNEREARRENAKRAMTEMLTAVGQG